MYECEWVNWNVQAENVVLEKNPEVSLFMNCNSVINGVLNGIGSV